MKKKTKKKSTLIAGAICTLALLGFAACGSNPDSASVPDSSVSVSDSDSTVSSGSTDSESSKPEITVAFDAEQKSAVDLWGQIALSATASDGSEVTYSSSDAGTVYVTGTTAYGVKEGKATITATAGEATATLEITVAATADSEKNAPTVQLSGKSSFDVGGTGKIGATLLYGRKPVTSGIEFKFDSSDKEVAEIAADGTLTLKKGGSTNITVTVNYLGQEFKAEKTITLIDNYTMSVENKSVTVDMVRGGDLTRQIVVEIRKNGEVFDGADVTYASSDSDVATVDKNGLITAVGQGSATVSVSVTLGDTSFNERVNVVVSVPRTQIDKEISYEFFNSGEVPDATLDFAALGISDVTADEVLDIKTITGETVAEKTEDNISFNAEWLKKAMTGSYECLLRSTYHNYAFTVTLNYHYINSSLNAKYSVSDSRLEIKDTDQGQVYEIADTATLRFDGAAIDAKYAEGYSFLRLDVYFKDAIPEAIEGNVGGAKIGFYNSHSTLGAEGGYSYVIAGTPQDGGGLHTPKNIINTDSVIAPFLVYGEDGNIVCDKFCNNKTDGESYVALGAVDGSMDVGRWYTLIIPLTNRLGTFASEGLTLSGLKNCYVRNYSLNTKDPMIKTYEDESGLLYEVARTTTGAYNRVERVWWGTDTYVATHNVKAPNGAEGTQGVYNVGADGFLTEEANKDAWVGAHFLSTGELSPFKANGAKWLRFKVNFHTIQTFASGHPDHTNIRQKNFNFFTYINDSWQYLTFSNSKGKVLFYSNNGGFNIYDGTTKEAILTAGKVSDWKSVTGKTALEAGKDYIFEYDISVGSYACFAMFCGCDDATISEITWSGNSLSDTTGMLQTSDLDMNVRMFEELEDWLAVEAVDGKVLIDTERRLGAAYEQIGTAEQFDVAYNSGYRYLTFKTSFPVIDETPHRMSVGGRNVYLNASTGEITSTDAANAAVAKRMFRIYDAETKELVTGGLTAEKEYIFTFDLTRRANDDFQKSTLQFLSGFDGCAISEVSLVDAAFMKKDYPVTDYKIEHYLPNGEGGYTVKNRIYAQGNIGDAAETAALTTDDYIKYELDENANNVLTGVIAANGGLTLKVYYKQVKAEYRIEHYKQNDSGVYELVTEDTEEKIDLIGKEISVIANEYEGYALNEEKSIVTGTITADGALVLQLYYESTSVDVGVTKSIKENGEKVTVKLSEIRASFTTETVEKVVIGGVECALTGEGEFDVGDTTDKTELCGEIHMKGAEGNEGKVYMLTVVLDRLWVGKLYELTLANAGAGYNEYWGMYWQNNVYVPYNPILKTADKGGVYDFASEGFITQKLAANSVGHWFQFDDRVQKTDLGYNYLRFTINFTEFMSYSINSQNGVNLVLQFGETWRYIKVTASGTTIYRLQNGAQSDVGMNIYAEDGTLLLDGMAKQNVVSETVLQAGVNYIIEVDATINGRAGTPIMSAIGFDKAKISNIIWAKECMHDYSAVPEMKEAGHLYEMKHNYVAGDTYNHCERLVWGASNYVGTMTGEKTNTDGVYNTASEGFFTEAANEHTWKGAHFLALDETPAKISAGYKRVRFKVTFNSFQTIESGHREHPERNFNMFFYLNDSWLYLTANNDGKSNLQRSGGLNVYDAATGALVLNGWSGATTGDALVTGKEYVFEFDISLGGYKCYLMFCGLDDATISEITWSDKAYLDTL